MSQIVAEVPDAAGPAAAEAAALDWTTIRHRMVDTQIRPNRVSDQRIIKAMRELPRELFVPATRAALAYADRGVDLGGGRVLMEPRIIGRMLQSAAPQPGEKALVVAAGTGYTASLLALLGLHVTALEQVADLAVRARQVCAGIAPGVQIEVGALADGWQPGAPYDLIIIDGAVRTLPDRIGAQLAPAGRLATVLWPENGVGTAVIAEPSSHGLRAWPQFDASTALIPELVPASQFSF